MDWSIFYSAQNNSFYPAELKSSYEHSLHGWPDDVVSVSEEDHEYIINGLSDGKIITPDKNGRPQLSEPVVDYKDQAELLRQSLLENANTFTDDWRTELKLDVISDNDKSSLIIWMAYIKELKVMDFSEITNKNDYDQISWPEVPNVA